jgi:hypothetical protein
MSVKTRNYYLNLCYFVYEPFTGRERGDRKQEEGVRGWQSLKTFIKMDAGNLGEHMYYGWMD